MNFRIVKRKNGYFYIQQKLLFFWIEIDSEGNWIKNPNNLDRFFNEQDAEYCIKKIKNRKIKTKQYKVSQELDEKFKPKYY